MNWLNVSLYDAFYLLHAVFCCKLYQFNRTSPYYHFSDSNELISTTLICFVEKYYIIPSLTHSLHFRNYQFSFLITMRFVIITVWLWNILVLHLPLWLASVNFLDKCVDIRYVADPNISDIVRQDDSYGVNLARKYCRATTNGYVGHAPVISHGRTASLIQRNARTGHSG